MVTLYGIILRLILKASTKLHEARTEAESYAPPYVLRDDS